MGETDKFTCCMCKHTFDKSWSDEEAEREYKSIWGSCEKGGTVCDDCFNAMNRAIPIPRSN